jgi:hypothetical protein
MKSQRGALNAKTNKSVSKKKLYFSKIKKFCSFFDFHTKWPKLQNRELHLVALILGFGLHYSNTLIFSFFY